VPARSHHCEAGIRNRNGDARGGGDGNEVVLAMEHERPSVDLSELRDEVVAGLHPGLFVQPLLDRPRSEDVVARRRLRPQTSNHGVEMLWSQHRSEVQPVVLGFDLQVAPPEALAR
jgi:hypothetical protein